MPGPSLGPGEEGPSLPLPATDPPCPLPGMSFWLLLDQPPPDQCLSSTFPCASGGFRRQAWPRGAPGRRWVRGRGSEGSPGLSPALPAASGSPAAGGTARGRPREGERRAWASPPHLSGCLLSPTQTGLHVPQEAERGALAAAQELQECGEGRGCGAEPTTGQSKEAPVTGAPQSCPQRSGPQAA